MRQYEKYKTVNANFVDELPLLWDVKKLSHGFGKIGSGTTPTAGNLEYYLDGKFNWLQTGDLNDAEITSTSKTITQKALDDFSTLKFFKADSVVIAMYGATIGKTGMLKIPSTTNQACCVLSDPKSFASKYVQYWFIAHKELVVSLGYGGGQPNISQEIIRALRIPCPPIDEQTAIAKYLDEKTAQIDTLMAKKHKMIELLKEERKAIISELVGKGLDPKIKFKPVSDHSEIPTHWTISRIGYISKVVRGASPRPAGDPQYFNGDHTPWITVGEVTKDEGKFITEVSEYLTEEGAKQSRYIEPGTLLLSNSGATLGVPKILKIGGCINDGSVAFLNLSKQVSIEFLYYFFKSMTGVYRDQMKGYGQPNLNTDIVKSTLFCYPLIEEQREIVKAIEARVDEIASTISKVANEITLLIEYKTALISEVVTGKVKVI